MSKTMTFNPHWHPIAVLFSEKPIYVQYIQLKITGYLYNWYTKTQKNTQKKSPKPHIFGCLAVATLRGIPWSSTADPHLSGFEHCEMAMASLCPSKPWSVRVCSVTHFWLMIIFGGLYNVIRYHLVMTFTVRHGFSMALIEIDALYRILNSMVDRLPWQTVNQSMSVLNTAPSARKKSRMVRMVCSPK
jgi:hypothetical protein